MLHEEDRFPFRVLSCEGKTLFSQFRCPKSNQSYWIRSSVDAIRILDIGLSQSLWAINMLHLRAYGGKRTNGLISYHENHEIMDPIGFR